MQSLATSKWKRPSAQPPDPNSIGFRRDCLAAVFLFACGILASVYFWRRWVEDQPWVVI